MTLGPQAIRDRAFAAAAKAHAESPSPQYGSQPYTVHLLAVEQVVIRYFEGTDLEWDLRIEAMLHDALEDTDLTEQNAVDLIGARRTVMVEAVTDEPGRNRKEKKGRTYPKIRKAGPEAVYLKLCDRIANWENCLKTCNSKHWMYYKEHWGIYGALYRDNDRGAVKLWARLQELHQESEEMGQTRRPKK